MPDNYDIWLKHEQELEDALKQLPVCEECDEPIQDDYCYVVNGVAFCKECFLERHRRLTEDYC